MRTDLDAVIEALKQSPIPLSVGEVANDTKIPTSRVAIAFDELYETGRVAIADHGRVRLV